MMHDPNTWKCGHCTFNIPLPPPEAYLYDIALEYIRNHRLEHLIVAIEGATDEDLLALCGDEPESTEPVATEDTAYVLAGVTELLKADLPRARKEQHQ